jgi:hypothetical protein
MAGLAVREARRAAFSELQSGRFAAVALTILKARSSILMDESS